VTVRRAARDIADRISMFFNSIAFLIFLPLVCLMYKMGGNRRQNVILLLASYVFYGWWDWRFLSLLWMSTIVDYCAGLGMARHPGRKKRILIASICVNMGVLGAFKYCDFFLQSTVRLLAELGFQPHLPILGLVLPVGISFYTFQTMAYSIDVYRGNQKPTTNLLSFALYVAYFPQLVAGPIERSTRLIPQIDRIRRVTRDDLAAAADLCVVGYFKKVFLADGVAPLVNDIFDGTASQGALSLLIGIYLFALQIYGDFSGYSDIARGVSRLFGIRLCINFSQPYLSSNITEFWRRWHISLSTWLRDYLYIPLGGNRKGALCTYANLICTMLLGGLWHGASWKFVVWGGIHGVFLSIHKLIVRGCRKGTSDPPGLRTALVRGAGVLTTFHLVCFAWVIFRAETLRHAMQILVRIAMPSGEATPQTTIAYVLFYGTTAVILDTVCRLRDRDAPFTFTGLPLLRGVAYGAMLFMILCIGATRAQPFIYFQF
jgi:alginate O-acetyltransferase complex protein AlgI